MAEQEAEKTPEKRPIARQVTREIRAYHPVKALLLWDILKDRDSRPVFYWALGTLLFGMFVYHWLEGWSYLDSLYFCVISTATIGYGDFVPTTPTARAFTIVYVLNGIVILLALFDRIRAVRGRELERATTHTSNPTSDPTT